MSGRKWRDLIKTGGKENEDKFSFPSTRTFFEISNPLTEDDYKNSWVRKAELKT